MGYGALKIEPIAKFDVGERVPALLAPEAVP
jgi:hypothetical protein